MTLSTTGMVKSIQRGTFVPSSVITFTQNQEYHLKLADIAPINVNKSVGYIQQLQGGDLLYNGFPNRALLASQPSGQTPFKYAAYMTPNAIYFYACPSLSGGGISTSTGYIWEVVEYF